MYHNAASICDVVVPGQPLPNAQGGTIMHMYLVSFQRGSAFNCGDLDQEVVLETTESMKSRPIPA